MALLGIIKNFNASHGTKKHEHNFKVELTLKGPVEGDMVKSIDFHEVKKILEEELQKSDGKYLNEFLNIRATVENIAIYLLMKLRKRKIENLYSIKIFEEFDRYIEIFDEEI
jgi:6-pyruvoyl-tetrahydropterin synthase